MSDFETASPPRVAWRISSRSVNGGGQCVEAGPVVDGSGRFAVRDSKNRHGGTVVFAAGTWSAFKGAIKSGDLSHG